LFFQKGFLDFSAFRPSGDCRAINGRHLPLSIRLRTIYQENAIIRDRGGCFGPPLTLFSTPLAPWRARDRLPSILALGNFYHVVSQSGRSPNLDPSPFYSHRTHSTLRVPKLAPRGPKMAPLRFCLFDCKLRSTMDDPDIYKRPWPLAHEDSTLWHSGLATSIIGIKDRFSILSASRPPYSVTFTVLSCPSQSLPCTSIAQPQAGHINSLSTPFPQEDSSEQQPAG
jgi:hypothetical protein